MKRLTISVVGGLVLAALIAPPVGAARPVDTGALPHSSFVAFFGVEFGQSEVVQVPTGDWVTLNGGWGTATAAQRQHFEDTVIVRIWRNGVPQPVTAVQLFFEGEETPYIVTFPTLIKPGRTNVAEQWTVQWEFTEDHYDGIGVTPAGTVFEGSRTIVWTPRGRFPSSAYPCPNGGYPCVDL